MGAALQRGRTPLGELWLGGRDGAPPNVVTRRASAASVGPRLAERYNAVLEGPPPPIWFDSDHCPFCPWRDACDAEAAERRDIATLTGLRRSHARALRAIGVRSVPELAALPHAALAMVEDSDDATARLLHANATALLNDQVVARRTHGGSSATPQTADGAAEAHVRTPEADETMHGPPLFLDIETDPLTRVPWAIGWLREGSAPEIVVVAPGRPPFAAVVEGVQLHLVPSVEAAWDLLLDTAPDAGPLLHWGDAESLLLQRTGGEQVRAQLNPRLRDLHASLTAALALPIMRGSTRRSGGLKAVAGWLGFRWPAGADHWADGWEAYQCWQRAEGASAAPSGALAPALRYLRADLEALALVWRWSVAVTGERAAA